jgi:hypothetical protein
MRGALLDRARLDFEQALRLQGDNIRAPSGLASIPGVTRDAAAAQALVPNAQQAMDRYGRSVNLARAVTQMCVATGQEGCARTFGTAWRAAALSDAERAKADGLLSQLQNDTPAAPAVTTAETHCVTFQRQPRTEG